MKNQQPGGVTEGCDFDCQLQSALTLKPTFTDAYNNMASALVQKGCIPQAMECYAAALRIDPNVVRVAPCRTLQQSARCSIACIAAQCMLQHSVPCSRTHMVSQAAALLVHAATTTVPSSTGPVSPQNWKRQEENLVPVPVGAVVAAWTNNARWLTCDHAFELCRILTEVSLKLPHK